MRLRVKNVTKDKLLADRAERAISFFERFKGLMGRPSLGFGEGLHILKCNSIHTFFMRIPIDVAFLDDAGVIVKQVSALPPWRATSIYRQARTAMELPAGTLTASGTQEGDRLDFEEIP
jgi:hypothetical protein